MNFPLTSKIPAFLLIVAALLLMTVTADTQETSFLPQELPDGFTLTKPVAFYNPGNLFELINGQAVFYLSYGFIKLEHAFYEKNGSTYSVDIYELADHLSAFGSYRQQKEDDAEELKAGCEGYITDHLAAFYKDKYYIEVIPQESGGQSAVDAMRILAGHVEAKIPGTSTLPPELDILPKDDLVAGSERYSGENLLSFSFMGRGLTARYLHKKYGYEYRIFIAFSESPQNAQKICDEFSKKLENPTSENLFDTVSGLTGTMAYRGKAIIFSYGSCAFGGISFSEIYEVKKTFEKLYENMKQINEIQKNNK